MTPEVRQQIRKALVACNGSRIAAAKALGMEPKTLYNRLYFDQELKAEFVGADKRSLSEGTLDVAAVAEVRKDLGVIDAEISDPLAVARAIAAEDRALKADLEEMGVIGERAKSVLSLRDFHRKHYLKVGDIVGGGITKMFIDLQDSLRDLNSDIDAIDPTDKDNYLLGREAILREDRRDLYKIMLSTYEAVRKMILTKAIIEHKLSGKRAAVDKPKGFLSIPMPTGSKARIAMEIEGDGGEKNVTPP